MEERYAYVATNIQLVMANIEEYVIPENRRIINYLWDMNILTTHTNNYENDFSWVALGELSFENHCIFWKYVNETALLDEKKFKKASTNQSFSVPVKPGTKDTFEDFKPLIDMLKFQDVQKDGYMTINEFFINCTDCWMIIDNPEYEQVLEPELEDYDSISEYQKAYDKYFDSVTKRKIKVVDQEKITKPLDDYLEEAGFLDCYDEEEGKIFLNRRLYEGHMRYKSQEEPKKHL